MATFCSEMVVWEIHFFRLHDPMTKWDNSYNIKLDKKS